jgi:hypothetical protein
LGVSPIGFDVSQIKIAAGRFGIRAKPAGFFNISIGYQAKPDDFWFCTIGFAVCDNRFRLGYFCFLHGKKSFIEKRCTVRGLFSNGLHVRVSQPVPYRGQPRTHPDQSEKQAFFLCLFAVGYDRITV